MNYFTKVCIVCPIHGEFWQTPTNHISNRNNCPKCNSSRGEEKIRNWLIEHNVEFEEQKRFKDCKDKLPLPFDFYLPKENVCIEFDGIQYFKSIERFGGNQSFEDRIKKDKIKTDYCLTHNVKLIRIRYDENVNEKLKIC